MSYLFDLYRGEELDPSFFEFALYMVFFPVTISGPICRMPEMLPQFRSEEPTSWDDIGLGFRRIATGVFMMQLAKLLGQRNSGRRRDQSRLRSCHTLERPGRLVPGPGIRIAAFFRFRRLLAHRDRRSSERLASPCPKTSRAHFNPPVRRFSGRAGTCRCLSGFATTFFFRWQSCAARCGGGISP